MPLADAVGASSPMYPFKGFLEIQPAGRISNQPRANPSSKTSCQRNLAAMADAKSRQPASESNSARGFLGGRSRPVLIPKD